MINNNWHKVNCNVCGFSKILGNKIKCRHGFNIKVERAVIGFEFYSTNCYLIRHKLKPVQNKKIVNMKTAK